MEKLVSVIIPCFNAERWLREAIDSCVKQTYSKIEIIVIDDGSTDNSLELIKSYGDKLIWETGSNKGGNHARNRGFALSRGEYIQYLDADDYMLPEKIESQVRCLEEAGADVAYGDWRYKRHLANGESFLDDIIVSGPKEDFLESLLADHQWVPPVALLFTRAAVEKSGGWDENLKVAQDRDFLISVVINGAKVAYQPDCHSIYRHYGTMTVSKSNPASWMESHFLLMEKAEFKLTKLDKLTSKYRQALAQAYFEKSRRGYLYLDYPRHLWVLRKILLLDPKFRFEGSTAYNLIQGIFGFMVAEIILRFKLRITNG